MLNIKNIKVNLPDSSSKIFDVEPKTIVRNLIIKIADSCNLICQSAIYGLYHKDDGGNKYWLVDSESLVCQKVLSLSVEPLNLYFSFKYITDIRSLTNDIATNYFFYHHLKESIYSGDLEIHDSDLCFRLIAMSVILNDEEIDDNELPTKLVKLIPGYLFLQHPSVDYCTQKIMQHRNKYSEKDSSELMAEFTETIIELPYQLIHFFSVQDSTGSQVVIGVGKDGIAEFNHTTKTICNLKQDWSEISNVTNDKSKLVISTQTGTFNKFRRENSALCLSYKTANSNLAKSIKYICKDIINFNYQMSDTPLSTSTQNFMSLNRSINSGKEDKTTPATLKKSQNLNNTSISSIRSNTSDGSFISHNHSVANRRSSVSSGATNNTFGEDHSISNCAGMSPSRMSISSYNQDHELNDRKSVYSASSYGKSMPEQQQRFEEMNKRRLDLIDQISSKDKELKQLIEEEIKITGEKPDDYDKCKPDMKFLITKCPVGKKLLMNMKKNHDKFEEQKATILVEIETLMQIIKCLKSGKEKKSKEKIIQDLRNDLKHLETQNALSKAKSRSSSMGNLNQVFPRDSHGSENYDSVLSGSHTLKRPSINDTNNNSNIVQSQIERLPVAANPTVSMATEPLSRRRNTNPSFQTNTTIGETYPGITEASDSPDSSSKIYHSNVLPNLSHNNMRNNPHYQSSPRLNSRRQLAAAAAAANNSNFQRFASARTPISTNSLTPSLNNSNSPNSTLSASPNQSSHFPIITKQEPSTVGSDNNLSSSSGSNVDSNASDISDMHFDIVSHSPSQLELQTVEIDEFTDSPTPTIKHHIYPSTTNRSTRTFSRTNQNSNSHVNVVRRPHFPRNTDYDQEFDCATSIAYRDSRDITYMHQQQQQQPFRNRKYRTNQPPSPLIGRSTDNHDPVESTVANSIYDRRITQIRSNTPAASRSRCPELRRSVSLEEVKPEEILISPEPSSEKDVTVVSDKPPIRNRLFVESPRLTIRPSKKDVTPSNLTRGRQPSIIHKSAKQSPTII